MKGLNRRPEYKKIMASLQPNEEVKAFGVAYIGSTDHTIVVTNIRVIIVAEKLFTKHFDSITLDNIQSSSLKNGFSGTFLMINNIKLRFRDKKQAETIYNLLTQTKRDESEADVELNQPTELISNNTVNKQQIKKNKISKPFIILGAAVVLIAIFMESPDKGETKQPSQQNEIVDVIIIDQAKHDAALKAQEEARANKASAKEWYDDGTLHNSTMAEWVKGSDANKLATCADWISSLYKNKALNQELTDAIDAYGMNGIKEVSKGCVAMLNEAYTKETSNEKANSLFALGVMITGWGR